MPKQTFKIESFHGGLNSNSDPRDIRENESPSLKDVAIDSVGKIKTLGSANSGVNDSNTSSILKNTGLFVMSSDRKIDGTLSNETLIFLHDNTSHTIDIKDSDGWSEEEISFSDGVSTVYYNADGVLRISDSNLARDPEWFGYVIDKRFASLNANSGSIGWINVDQKLSTPTSGKCLISNPEVGNDSAGIFSSSSEYIGAVLNSGGGFNVANHSAVNLRVGVQLNEILFDSNHSDWTEDTRCVAQANDSFLYPCIGTKVARIQGNDTTNPVNFLAKTGLDFSLEEGNSLIVPVFIISSELNKLIKFTIEIGKLNDSGNITTETGFSWEFGVEKIKPNMWNFLVCSGENISLNSDRFPKSDCDYLAITMKDKAVILAGGSTDKMDYYISGIAITDAQSVQGFTPNTYTFHHTYLYDEENKQESLPFKFNDVDLSSTFTLTGSINPTGTNVNVPGTSTKYTAELKIGDEITVSGETRVIASITNDTTATVTVAWGSDLANDTSVEVNPIGEYDNLNSINVVGSSVLFNFDTYICSNNAAGNAYGLNKRISGSRLYYKKEENDNYFLIGELDFVEKGFKFLPEADTLSYPMSNTTSQTTPILSRTALIKAISPETANTIDTFKTINGFSTEVKSLDAKYKTAVVHGRRVYIGNIKRPDGKTYPDRIVKSQVNRFDTFPEGMGAVDVVIRDGESIVKLEAYADRILQFKEHSLYIVNVSESVDFLEDTFRNKGCAFDYHVVRTDLGIAWFNDHGCYLYDGKSVIHLLEKNNLRLISEEDWSLFVKDGTDDLDMSSAMVGYVPKKKHLIIKNENNDIYLYDFVLQAWTTGIGKISESTAMTNFALDGDQDLFYIDNTTTVRKTWQSSPQSSTGFEYITQDIDFGQPGLGKKVYKVIITYKSGATTNVQVDYDVNGGTTFPYDFANGNNFTSNELASASGWQVAELIPDNASESNNIKSFQLRFATDGTVPSGFEINDITIIYRLKNIK